LPAVRDRRIRRPPRALRGSGPDLGIAPDGSLFGITVERLDDCEVSPYLAGELRPGDQLQLRGPIAGLFVWEPSRGGPLQLVAGGTGTGSRSR
jgi:ferredoxin-NADP reductase